jgi:hypothetical protein
MQKEIHRTSTWGLATMIHAIHMGDDVATLDAFYEDVFGGVLFMGIDEPNYLPWEKRYASLVLVGDLCIETMAPEQPIDLTTPVGKYFDRFGHSWHSIGYKVDDLPGLGRHLQDQGVFIGKPGGGAVEDLEETVYFYPHPRHTGGVMVECCKGEMGNDPRLREDWSSLRKLWLAHPLGAVGLAWVTIGVKDLEEHLELYTRLFEVEPVLTAEDEVAGHRSQFVQMGDAVIEMAMPTRSGTPLADHVDRYGDKMFGVTLRVVDLDRAAVHLASKGIRTTPLGADTIVADPADTHGAPWSFTVRELG